MLPPGGRPHPPTPARVPSTGRAGRRLWTGLPEPASRVPSRALPTVAPSNSDGAVAGPERRGARIPASLLSGEEGDQAATEPGEAPRCAVGLDRAPGTGPHGSTGAGGKRHKRPLGVRDAGRAADGHAPRGDQTAPRRAQAAPPAKPTPTRRSRPWENQQHHLFKRVQNFKFVFVCKLDRELLRQHVEFLVE